MTRQTALPADHEVTPSQLIVSVRAARAQAHAAELEVLRLAVAWAHAHPDLETDAAGVRACDQPWRAPSATAFDDGAPVCPTEEEIEGFGIPPVAWNAPVAFAAANAMPTASGRGLIRDALVLRHRLPATLRCVEAGLLPVWRAREVAQTVLGQAADVAAYVDAEVADRVRRGGSIGPITLDRVLDEAMLRLHAEERELEQLEALDARYATLHESSINHTGIVEMTLRGTWPDLKDFDATLAEVAAAMAREAADAGELVECLDVRRSIAVGVLADPAGAPALLARTGAVPGPGAGPESRAGRRHSSSSRRRVELVVHLTDLALLGLDPVAHTGSGLAAGPGAGRPTLEQTVREWCGRPDTAITVRPVLDVSRDVARDGYRPSRTQHDLVALRDQT